MSTNFNLTRLAYYIKRQVYLNINSMWISLAVVLGLLLIITFFTPITINGNAGKLFGPYSAIFFIFGLIFTSKVFHEMNSTLKSYSFLTLPVSNLEKIVGSWLISSPVYVIVFSLLVFLLSGIVSLFGPGSLDYSSVITTEFLKVIGLYMVVQTIFFLGACNFKGNNFLKTLLATFITGSILLLFTSLAHRLLFDANGMVFIAGSDMKSLFHTTFIPLLKLFFWGIFGPFMLLVSYFKLKERQI